MLQVMIVEDEHLVRIGIKNSVDWGKFDMKVIGDVENGKQALEYYKKYCPDIIITDLKMPVMGGLELIQKIRDSDKRTRFIILSCLDEFHLVKEAMRMDVTAYILKLTSDQSEIEEALMKACSEIKKLQELPLHTKYLDKRVVNEQVFRDFLVYGKIPASSFRQFLEFSENAISPEQMRILMLRFPNYSTLLSKQKDPLGYELRNVVVDLLAKQLEGFVPGEVHNDHGQDFIILVCFAGMTIEQEVEILNKLVIQIKESIMWYFNEAVLIGISSSTNELKNLPNLRIEALRALEGKNPLPYKIEISLDYISAYYMEDINIQDVADYVGISPNYLGHLFSQHLNTTFTEQLNKERIKHAKSFLGNPQYMIYEVGSKVGIENTTYFTRLFKRYTGKTPSDYRKDLGL